MNSATDRPQDERTDVVGTLRRFHYGEPAATQATQRPEGAILPALLNPYRDASAIRYQYPLYLAPLGAPEDAALAVPLTEHLAQGIESFSLSPDSARVLKDNLPWFERYLRQKLTGPDPVDAPSLFDEAANALDEHLELDGSNRDKLRADLASLRAAIADGSRFLGYGPDAGTVTATLNAAGNSSVASATASTGSTDCCRSRRHARARPRQAMA